MIVQISLGAGSALHGVVEVSRRIDVTTQGADRSEMVASLEEQVREAASCLVAQLAGDAPAPVTDFVPLAELLRQT